MWDDLLGFLLKCLDDASVLDKTVVIAYGDHGDDFYFLALYLHKKPSINIHHLLHKMLY